MTAVSSRSHGGLLRRQRISNPFDSDDDEPATSSTSPSQVSNSSSSSARSTRFINPFDDEASSHGLTKSSNRRTVESLNPVDDDDYPAKPSNQAANGRTTRSGHSNHSSSGDMPNPFDDSEEVTSKPKSRGESILDDGSLFDDEDMPARPTRVFATKIMDGGSRIKESSSRMKESASSSLSSVKLPTFSSASASTQSNSDEKSEVKRGKSKQPSKDLFGEVEPGYRNSQQSYFTHTDQSRFANQTVEQLEQYAIAKSQETTGSIKNAIRIAEDTKGVATRTLETLHEQGEQIRRTHQTAVHVDQELGRGEKLLGSLGGIFSMTWKPKKAHRITGPQVDPDRYKRNNNLGERAEFGLHGETVRPKLNLSGMNTAHAQLEMEKNTQDEAMSDLSSVLGQLKGMTLEMGNEIERQNGDLDRMHDDVQELGVRVKGANNRTRHLLGR